MSVARPGRRSPQISRIARLLGVDPDDVQGLDGLDDRDLRELYGQISRALYAGAQARLKRVAGLSAVIPGPLAGKLAERFLPPVIAARVSELLEPSRARDLVGRVRVTYLADIAVALDPVRSRPVVEVLPAKRIGEVARELFARGEYVVMAEFVDAVSLAALEAAFEVASPRDLLAVVPLLDWSERLDRVVVGLPVGKVRAIVDELAVEQLAELALALDPSRFGPVVEQLDPQSVAEIARVLFARDEHEAMARFAAVVTPEMLVAALDVATYDDLRAIVPHLEWTPAIERVVAELPSDRVRTIVDQLPPEALAGLAIALDPSGLGAVVEQLDPQAVAEIARVLFARDEHEAMARFAAIVTPEMLVAALDVATYDDLRAIVPHLEWTPAIEQVVNELPDRRLADLAAELGPSSAH